MGLTPEEIREEARRQYQAKIDALEAELHEYESDFVILQEAGDEVAQLYAACDLTSSAVSSVGVTLNEIYGLGTSDKVPGFERLFTNFGEGIMGDVNEVNGANNNCISELETTGSQIDKAKTQVATEIKRLVRDINFYSECLASI